MADIFEILKTGAEKNASDIHLTPGKPPMTRINGEMMPMSFPVLSSIDIKTMIYALLGNEQQVVFEQKWELDTSFQLQQVSRFRVNLLRQKDGMGAVLRIIPATIPEPEDIRLPKNIVDLTKLNSGLVLVTGATGSGKSTTLAALLGVINRERKGHIITIEDPIEYVYESANCVITQREVGSHTHSVAESLRHILRQDPDVVLIGEMRDLETIAAAITIAETGHLVFATLHTNDAAQTVDRIIDVFPSHQQQQVRMQLSVALRAVISQQLLPRKDGKGRVASRELMFNVPAISNLIREGKTHLIYNAIETGTKLGMVSMDRALYYLIKEGMISMEDAVSKAHNAEQLKSYVGMSGV
jgi:twitching motility protein PilT